MDSNDQARFLEAKEELSKLLSEDELRSASVLVFANKQDLPNAAKPDEISHSLGLHDFRDRKWKVQGACASTGDGLYEGLDWLSTAIKK